MKERTMRESIKLQSYVDRNGNFRFYWVDELRGERSRWGWDSEEDARAAMQDGIEWERN